MRISITLTLGQGKNPRVIELSRRHTRMALIGLGVVIGAVLGMAWSWGSVARHAVTARSLAAENAALVARQTRIDTLAAQIAFMEAQQERIRSLFGVVATGESDLWQLMTPQRRSGASGTEARDTVHNRPALWPLTVPGHLTNTASGSMGHHPGIDIAVPEGSYVRAAGRGEVVAASLDSVYGLFVLIDHGDGVQSRYAHASYLVADSGMSVAPGEVIALSGSTGRSTAPHLHFEVLVSGEQVDPLTMVTPP